MNRKLCNTCGAEWFPNSERCPQCKAANFHSFPGFFFKACSRLDRGLFVLQGASWFWLVTLVLFLVLGGLEFFSTNFALKNEEINAIEYFKLASQGILFLALLSQLLGMILLFWSHLREFPIAGLLFSVASIYFYFDSSFSNRDVIPICTLPGIMCSWMLDSSLAAFAPPLPILFPISLFVGQMAILLFISKIMIRPEAEPVSYWVYFLLFILGQSVLFGWRFLVLKRIRERIREAHPQA